MRRMWQVIRGRSADDTIYKAFETSRERFTRVINTGVIRYGKGELAGLRQLTGLAKEVGLSPSTVSRRLKKMYNFGKE